METKDENLEEFWSEEWRWERCCFVWLVALSHRPSFGEHFAPLLREPSK